VKRKYEAKLRIIAVQKEQKQRKKQNKKHNKNNNKMRILFQLFSFAEHNNNNHREKGDNPSATLQWGLFKKQTWQLHMVRHFDCVGRQTFKTGVKPTHNQTNNKKKGR
jgi:hypothetical protein